MLSDLSIRDVVLIERLDLAFGPGLAVLTGETGAGKSILLDSLGLALGARAEARLVRTGADKASVTASFHLSPGHPARAILAEQDVVAENDLILRRTLTADGRSKAFVNDEPVSVALLKRLGETLVEIQGQFDQHGLLDPQGHRGILDAFGATGPALDRVAEAYRTWRAAGRALEEAKAKAAQAARDEAFLRHAADELSKLGLKPGEEAELANERALLQNAEKLGEAMTGAISALIDGQGADSRLREAQKLLGRVADKAGGRLDEAMAALDRAAVEIQEAVGSVERVAGALDADGRRLEHVEERLFAIRDMARKYNRQPDDLPKYAEEVAEQLALISDGANRLEGLGATLASSRAAYVAAAEALSVARKAAAGRLDAAVNGELLPLKLERARFATTLERLEEHLWGADGLDRIAFEVATNPGSAPGPIGKIASGGELSRFLLALKLSLADAGSAPTLVFDEVDSGVGGATAAAVGSRLKRLAEGVQVLVVTHSPQVAALGATHLKVEKQEAGGRMSTGVVPLSYGERKEELARMLSGAVVTPEARAAAARLLQGVDV